MSARFQKTLPIAAIAAALAVGAISMSTKAWAKPKVKPAKALKAARPANTTIVADGETFVLKGQPVTPKLGENEIYELSAKTRAELERIRQLLVSRFVDTRPFLEKEVLSRTYSVRFTKYAPEGCDTVAPMKDSILGVKLLGCVEGDTLWLHAREFAKMSAEIAPLAILHVLIETAVANDNSNALEFLHRNIVILSRLAREGEKAKPLESHEIATMKQFWMRAASLGMPVQPRFANRVGERATRLSLKSFADGSGHSIHRRGGGLILNPSVSRVPESVYLAYDSLVDSAELPEDAVVTGSIVRGGVRIERAEYIERSYLEASLVGGAKVVRDSVLIDARIDGAISIEGVEAERADVLDVQLEGDRNSVIDVELSGPSNRSASVSGSRIQGVKGAKAKVSLGKDAKVSGSVIRPEGKGATIGARSRIVDSVMGLGEFSVDEDSVVERSWVMGDGFVNKEAIVRDSMLDGPNYSVWQGSTVESSIIGGQRGIMILVGAKLKNVNVNGGLVYFMGGSKAEKVSINQGASKLYISACLRVLYGSQQPDSIRKSLIESGKSAFDCDRALWNGSDRRKVAIDENAELTDVTLTPFNSVKVESGAKLASVSIRDPNSTALVRTMYLVEARNRDPQLKFFPSSVLFARGSVANDVGIQLDLDSFTRAWNVNEPGFTLVFKSGSVSAKGKKLVFRKGVTASGSISVQSDKDLLSLVSK